MVLRTGRVGQGYCTWKSVNNAANLPTQVVNVTIA